MRKGITRGLLLGLVLLALDALYIWLRYHPETTELFFLRLSNSLFLFGLGVLIVGMVIFSRLFSYRRRMGLKKFGIFDRFNSKEEYDEHVRELEKMNVEDEETLRERGRDITLMVTAAFMLLTSILMTFNQIRP